jgi:hypothetical protein
MAAKLAMRVIAVGPPQVSFDGEYLRLVFEVRNLSYDNPEVGPTPMGQRTFGYEVLIPIDSLRISQ